MDNTLTPTKYSVIIRREMIPGQKKIVCISLNSTYVGPESECPCNIKKRGFTPPQTNKKVGHMNEAEVDEWNNYYKAIGVQNEDGSINITYHFNVCK